MILLKKTIRSMLKNKKSYLSCIFLMSIGIMMYVSMNTSMLVIENSKNIYYEENRLADAFANVVNISSSGIDELESIDGIEKVEGRIIQEYQVYTEDTSEELVLKLISTKIDDDTRLNDYESSAKLENIDDILIGERFFSGNGYETGDEIQFIVNNKLVNFNIAGYVNSPEYVFIMKSSIDFLTDTTKYNIGYIEETVFMNLTGGGYNELAFKLEDGVEFKDIESQLRYTLEKYGLVQLYTIKDQLSYSMLETETESNKSMASSMPVVFVGMASIMLYLMLKRIIEQDRAQIGMMKAFGYSNISIILHYILYGFITGLLGGLCGVIFSGFIIDPLVNYFVTYYNLPIAGNSRVYSYFILGMLLSVFGGILGGVFGAKSVLVLLPSEAMRPKAPKFVKNDILKKLPFLRVILSNGGIMAIRNIGRNKMRSFFIVIGIIFSYGMIAVIGNMTTALNGMFYNQYNLVLKYDGEIILKNVVDREVALTSVDRLEGIEYSEGVLKIPITFYNGHKEATTYFVALDNVSQLYKIYDEPSDKYLTLKETQIILTSNVANEIGVETGDYIYAKSQYFDENIKFYISDIATQSLGFEAYIDNETLDNIIGENDIISSIIFKSTDISLVKKQLLGSKNIESVVNKLETQKNNEVMLQSYKSMINIMQLMTIVLAFSIIYNTASISLSERSREYATLRIMGMEIKEVCEIMNFEYWVLYLIGLIGGYPFAIFLNSLIQNMVDIESFSMPSYITFNAHFMAIIGCAIAVGISNFYSRGAIKKFDLVEVLKERE